MHQNTPFSLIFFSEVACFWSLGCCNHNIPENEHKFLDSDFDHLLVNSFSQLLGGWQHCEVLNEKLLGAPKYEVFNSGVTDFYTNFLHVNLNSLQSYTQS